MRMQRIFEIISNIRIIFKINNYRDFFMFF